MQYSRLIENKINNIQSPEKAHSSITLKKPRKHQIITFRQCIQQVGRDGKYQHNVFILMTIFWISSSLFLAYPFYLFQKAHYYKNNINDICLQYDQQCILQICQLYYPTHIYNHVKQQATLTYKFQLFCSENKSKRNFYKSAIITLSFIGLLTYGYIADKKGRKIAMKIAWRFYTIGVLIFCSTQTQLLMMFGYFIASVNCFPSLILQFILMFETTNNQMRLSSFLRILASGFFGSLLSALIAGLIIDNFGHIRLTIFLTVGLPALVLCFFLDYIQQSSTFLYKDNKIKAFNSINRIARKNHKQIILIDLGSSQWVKLQNYKVSFKQMFQMQEIKYKLLALFCLLYFTVFNSRSSQIGMDLYTQSNLRGILINGATALAYFTLILTKIKIKINYLLLSNLILNIIYFVLINFIPRKEQTQSEYLNILIITNLVFIRYISQMIYGNLLIIGIQNCPTVVRGQALGFILSSISLSQGIARILNGDQQIVSILNLVGTLICMIIQLKRVLNLQKSNKMPDTIKGYFYDQYDKFVRIYKD